MTQINSMTPKVFCVGFNKTGTSTMKKCFEALGMVPVACPSASGMKPMRLFSRIVHEGDYATSLSLARGYAAFEDRPWNVWEMYRRADQAFPGSKFILTLRDSESWWRSVENWIVHRKPHLLGRYLKHLKASHFSKADFIRGYEAYNREVISYFQDADNFLVVNLAEGDAWGKLCPFLDKPLPRISFPHANQQRYEGS